MTKTRIRAVAIVAALALATVGMPAPNAAADSTCDAEEFYRERGFVGLTHPLVNQDVRISQTLYLQLFNRDTVPHKASFVNLQSWTNGQDAYVVDLPCRPDGLTHDYCLERLHIFDDDDAGSGFHLFDAGIYDYEVAFYGPAPDYNLVDEPRDPEVSPDGKDCWTAPSGAAYAVVYLTDGLPTGVQINDQVFGPYYEHFNFYLEGDLA